MKAEDLARLIVEARLTIEPYPGKRRYMVTAIGPQGKWVTDDCEQTDAAFVAMIKRAHGRAKVR